MRPRIKYALWILGIVAGLVVLGAIAIYVFVDAEFYRDTLQARLETALDREVRLGDMGVSIFPTLGLQVDDIEIGPRRGVDEPALLTADRLRVGARLGPLLKKRLEVTSVVIQAPELTVVRTADGAWQPDRLLADGVAAGDAAPDDPSEAGGAALTIDELRIEDATVRVQFERPDGGLEPAMTLDALSARLTVGGDDGAFRIDMDTTIPEFEHAELEVAVDGRGLLAGADAPLDLTIRAQLENLVPTALVRRVGALFELDGLPAEMWTSDAVVVSAHLGLPAGGGPPSITNIEIDGLRFDLAGSPAGIPAILDDVRVTLDRLPLDEPATINLDGVVAADGDDGRIRVQGALGPLPDDPANVPLDLQVDVETIPLRVLAPLVPAEAEVDLRNATMTATINLAGVAFDRLSVQTDATLAGATVSSNAPDGSRRVVPLDAGVRGTVQVIAGGERVELGDLAIDPAGSGQSGPLTLRGSIDLGADLPVVDLKLLPTRIVADDLAAWTAVLLPDVPLSFSSPNPVEIEMAIRGELGGEQLPDVRGRASLSGFTFRHPSMTQPAEQVRGVVRLDGERVRLNDLHAVVGASDVSGDIVVVLQDSPVVTIELVSDYADFWELFSFVDSEESSKDGTPDASAASEEGPSILDTLRVEGTIRIADGLLRTLKFRDLESGVLVADRVLTLDPLSMELYGGRFDGRIVQDMRETPSTLDFSGKASGVALDPFLAENLGLGGLVSGAIGTELSLQLAAGDMKTVMSSLTGGGSLRVTDGNIAKLEVLQPLSKVAGMFGEQTLKSLSGDLAGKGTSFRTLETRLAFDGGRALFDNVVLETPHVTLEGAGALDLANAVLNGNLAAVFSPELSAAMSSEGSRAAQVFMDSRGKQVRVPFSIEGPMQAPSVGVNWRQAAESTLERTLGQELNKLLGGRKKEPSPPPVTKAAPSSPAPSGSEPTSSGQALAPAESAAPVVAPAATQAVGRSGTITVKIRETRWGGSFIGPDLHIKYVVKGVDLDRAMILVVDTNGREYLRDQIGNVDKGIKAAVAGEEMKVSSEYEVDGKRLLTAKFPLTVTITAYDRAGDQASASMPVQPR